MTDRDRLIELHHEAGVEWDNYLFECIDNDKIPSKTYDEFHADHLLANGVLLLPEDLRGTEDFSISAFIEAMQMYKQKDRYIKTPCKVGDKVYYPYDYGNKVLEKTVKRIVIENNDKWLDVGVSFLPFENIGRTVFLTKEEAEKKLKEFGK